MKVQRDEDHTPWCLENLMLCSTKLCTADYIDRNYCFRVGLPHPQWNPNRLSLSLSLSFGR